VVSHSKRKRIFENKVLKRMFGPKREEVTEGREHRMMNFIIRTFYQILLD